MNCTEVGDANPDIAGIGIVVSFIVQASLAVIMSFYSFILNGNKTDRTVEPAKENRLELEPWQIKQAIVNKMLLQGSDIQSMTGIALLVSALVQIDSLPFYHLHIIYDTVSLVAVSNAAAIACSFKSSLKRYGLILLWSILFIIYTSLFGVRLRGWNWNIGGHCYNPHKISLPTASHPHVDYIYIGFTCFYVFGSLVMSSGSVNLYFALMFSLVGPASTRTSLPVSTLFHEFQQQRFKTSWFSEMWVLSWAALQVPLHLYSLLALRASNDKLLNSGITEQEWGFGQIVAVMLLGTNVLGLLNGVQDYRKWKKLLAEHRAGEEVGQLHTN